jgi:hypothetical protein
LILDLVIVGTIAPTILCLLSRLVLGVVIEFTKTVDVCHFIAKKLEKLKKKRKF